jgi:hypothetical protein
LRLLDNDDRLKMMSGLTEFTLKAATLDVHPMKR